MDLNEFSYMYFFLKCIFLTPDIRKQAQTSFRQYEHKQWMITRGSYMYVGNLTITIPFLTIDIWALITKIYQTCLLVSFYFLDENECVR